MTGSGHFILRSVPVFMDGGRDEKKDGKKTRKKRERYRGRDRDRW